MGKKAKITLDDFFFDITRSSLLCLPAVETERNCRQKTPKQKATLDTKNYLGTV
jgi:hypothetical protein